MMDTQTNHVNHYHIFIMVDLKSLENNYVVLYLNINKKSHIRNYYRECHPPACGCDL